ncbi:MAG: heavy metal translocating P-type ATPase [Betaproteobacteria bacterium]|nr:heavy metal translocating P-type ATPase [Betaproteobacteria bacterium]
MSSDSNKTTPASACATDHCHSCEAPAPAEQATPKQLPPGTALYRISSMDCAAEEAEIRRALEPVPGIKSLSFQLGARTLGITAPQDTLPTALAAIREAGFSPVEVAQGEATANAESEHGIGAGLVRLSMALVFAIGAESMEFLFSGNKTATVIGLVLAVVAIGLAGFETYLKGFQALRRGKLNINALMSIAVTGAFVIGQWPEAAMVMALYAIAELIEARSVDRARNAIQGLMALAPEEAAVKQPDGTWLMTRASDVALDAIVRIRPGERVSLDGVVVRGNSTINQAPVTGESIPVEKASGDQVFAGTINEAGELEFKVTAAASNSTLARIIHAVEEAQGSRAETQRFVDKFAAVYTPLVFVLALGVALLTPWLLDWTWMQAIYKALVLLVIACPCALVISTPVTVVSALAAAARQGILIKGGAYLESARKLKVIALDKTGTITEGKPKLITHQVLVGEAAQAEQIALSLAGRSDHPVSKAIAAGLSGQAREVDSFAALPGRGVQGVIAGTTYVLGNHRLVEERGQCSPEIESLLASHEQNGRTVTLLASDRGVLAVFAVADAIKPTSKQAIAELTALGIKSVMLTGDNEATAQSIAREAGIAEARGNLLPEDKLTAIQDLQKKYGMAGMSGDGINDAPALAKADIGIAMGAAGTDTAIETADVVIMNDNLRRIPTTIRLSRKTHTVLWQNISFALGVKAVFFLLAVFGSATMWMAVFADMGASLLVVVNGLRLLKTGQDD